ncbi:MAG: hypothetical protein QXQ70_08365 [Candidatus Caldarchaeum sp.]
MPIVKVTPLTSVYWRGFDRLNKELDKARSNFSTEREIEKELETLSRVSLINGKVSSVC